MFLNQVKNVFASRTQILLAKQMFSSLATRAAIPGKQCFLLAYSSFEKQYFSDWIGCCCRCFWTWIVFAVLFSLRNIAFFCSAWVEAKKSFIFREIFYKKIVSCVRLSPGFCALLFHLRFLRFFSTTFLYTQVHTIERFCTHKWTPPYVATATPRNLGIFG